MSTAQIVTGKCTGKRAIIAKAFKKVALFPDMRDRWVTCETWASEINKRTSEGVDIEVTGGTVSSSLSRDELLKNNAHIYSRGGNETGYFKVEWDHKHIYYVCNAGDYIERPKLTANWYAKVMNNQQTVAVTDADDSIAVPNQDRTKRRKTRSGEKQPQHAIVACTLKRFTMLRDSLEHSNTTRC
jgi:hypothetical protein